MTLRDATPADAAGCAGIYAPYVRDTAITFEVEPPDTKTVARRIAAAQRRHAWLVDTDHAGLSGFAYGGEFKSRPAYRWSCEVSIYLDPTVHRVGRGRALYEMLLERLAGQGYCTAVAVMTLPNEASAGLHRALGFQPAGVLRGIGWKHDQWHDVQWFQRPLNVA